MVFSSIAFIMYFMPVFPCQPWFLLLWCQGKSGLSFTYDYVCGGQFRGWKTDCGTEDEAGEESLACGWNRL